MFFKDPANIFVVAVMAAFIAFIVWIRINSDKTEREGNTTGGKKGSEVK